MAEPVRLEEQGLITNRPPEGWSPTAADSFHTPSVLLGLGLGLACFAAFLFVAKVGTWMLRAVLLLAVMGLIGISSLPVLDLDAIDVDSVLDSIKD